MNVWEAREKKRSTVAVEAGFTLSDLFGVDCDKLYDVEAAGGDAAAVVISGEVM